MTPVLSSTFILTLLLGVGLMFFIRAATKDRTEWGQYETPWDEVTLLERLQRYFSDRAYQVHGVDPEAGEIRLLGWVRASAALAVFLSLLAAVGLACFALVLALLWPQGGWAFGGLVLLAPLAGVFYWRGASRQEAVTFRVRPTEAGGSTLQVSAHRDELLTLQTQLGLQRLEE